MIKTTYKFSSASVDYYMASKFSQLKKLSPQQSTLIITDENVYNAHPAKFKGWNTIILQPGEENKVQSTVDDVIEEMIAVQADRGITLVGVGGGVVTDITGYTASVYMRGLRFGFVPTSLLAMVDASIGGKNGIDVGRYKNMIGTIRQPDFILQDLGFLDTLPDEEWENGFTEIIKHACIRDAAMFRQLEEHSLKTFRKKKILLTELVKRNTVLKTKIVQKDEFERGERRLLNFGHTLGHALENQYELSHGHAVSIGMTYACRLSDRLLGFSEQERVIKLLEAYNLPTTASFDAKKVFEVLKMDKKRERKALNYVLLEKIGKAVVKSIPLRQLEKLIAEA
jgi:3-dehydroquinate synthase